MARESKAELTDRLRREGRWESFIKRREQLKSQGVPASDARIQAAMEFPPVNEPSPTQARPTATRRQLRHLKRKPAIGMLKAAQWVAGNLDCEWVLPRDAPSMEAWSLLAWARQSNATRSEFYRIFGKSLAASPVSTGTMPDQLPDLEDIIGMNNGGRPGRTC